MGSSNGSKSSSKSKSSSSKGSSKSSSKGLSKSSSSKSKSSSSKGSSSSSSSGASSVSGQDFHAPVGLLLEGRVQIPGVLTYQPKKRNQAHEYAESEGSYQTYQEAGEPRR